MFIDSYNTVIFDIDGTILYGQEVISGAAELIDFLVRNDKKLCFLTNNSTDNANMIRKKLVAAGLNVPQNAPIITACDITSAYLLEEFGRTSLTVFGSAALRDRLAEDHKIVSDNPKFLVHGRHLDLCYDDIKKGIEYLRNGAKLVLTNVDLTHEYLGDLSPETGLLSAALVRYACNDFISPGKPSQFAFSFIFKRYCIERESAVLIGDNPDTDISGANLSGISSIFLNHSGEKTHSCQPSLTVNSLFEVIGA